MNIDQLLIQSLQLLGLGMGSVFIILSLLIVVITLVSKLVPKAETAPVAAPSSTTTVDSQHIAAIQAAIHRYRRARRA